MTARANSLQDEMAYSLNERRLDPQAVERLPGMRAGDAIACTSGVLWITQAGDPKDYVLEKGGAFVTNRQGAVVVQALTPAAYRLFSHYKTRAGEVFWVYEISPDRLLVLDAPGRDQELDGRGGSKRISSGQPERLPPQARGDSRFSNAHIRE